VASVAGKTGAVGAAELTSALLTDSAAKGELDAMYYLKASAAVDLAQKIAKPSNATAPNSVPVFTNSSGDLAGSSVTLASNGDLSTPGDVKLSKLSGGANKTVKIAAGGVLVAGDEVYSRSDVDGKLSSKADASSLAAYYTAAVTDTKFLSAAQKNASGGVAGLDANSRVAPDHLKLLLDDSASPTAADRAWSVAKSASELGKKSSKPSIPTTANGVAVFANSSGDLAGSSVTISAATGDVSIPGDVTLSKYSAAAAQLLQFNASGGLAPSGTTLAQLEGRIAAKSDTTALQNYYTAAAADAKFEKAALKDQKNGFAGLDGDGKIDVNRLPVIGLTFAGEWDPTAGALALANNAFVLVKADGAQYRKGDFVIKKSDGTLVHQTPATSGVSSFLGKTGPISETDLQQVVYKDSTSTAAATWSSAKISSELQSRVAKPAASAQHKLVKFADASGAIAQAGGVQVDDSSNVAGVNNLTVQGQLASGALSQKQNEVVRVGASGALVAGGEVYSKAEVDRMLLAGLKLVGEWNPTTNDPPLAKRSDVTNNNVPGNFYLVKAPGGAFDGVQYSSGDWVIVDSNKHLVKNTPVGVTAVADQTGGIVTTDYLASKLLDNSSAAPNRTWAADKLASLAQTKADAAAVYSKTDTYAKTETYNRAETDGALAKKLAKPTAGIVQNGVPRFASSGELEFSAVTVSGANDVAGVNHLTVGGDLTASALRSSSGEVVRIGPDGKMEAGGRVYTQAQTDAKLGTMYTKTETDAKLGTMYTKTETDAKLSTMYTKTETDAKLGTMYTKTETDAKLGTMYTKTETDAKLGTMYTKTETDAKLGTMYTKTETDGELAKKFTKPAAPGTAQYSVPRFASSGELEFSAVTVSATNDVAGVKDLAVTGALKSTLLGASQGQVVKIGPGGELQPGGAPAAGLVSSADVSSFGFRNPNDVTPVVQNVSGAAVLKVGDLVTLSLPSTVGFSGKWESMYITAPAIVPKFTTTALFGSGASAKASFVKAVDGNRWKLLLENWADGIGACTFQYRAQDATGLPSPTVAWGENFEVDAPRVVLPAPNAAQRVKDGDNFTVTLVFDESVKADPKPKIKFRNGEEVALVQDSTDAKKFTAAVAAMQAAYGPGGTTDGDVAVEVSGAEDLVGNPMVPQTGVVVAVRDTTRPSILPGATPEPNSTYKNEAKINFLYRFSEALKVGPTLNLSGAVERFQVAMTESTAVPNQYSYEYQVPATGADGQIHVSIEDAEDLAGNEMAAVQYTLFRDSTGPILTSFTATPDRKLNASDTLSLTATYGEALLKPPALADLPPGPVPVPTADATQKVWTWTFPLATYASGRYTVTASGAVDLAGNVQAGPGGKVTFEVDTGAPTVLSATFDRSPPDYKKGDVAVLTVRFSEALRDTPPPTVRFAGSAEDSKANHELTPDAIDKTKWTLRYTLAGSGSDTNTRVRVSGATDVAGNVIVPDSEIPNVVLRVDNTAPTVVGEIANSAGRTFLVQGDRVKFSVNFTEDIQVPPTLTLSGSEATQPLVLEQISSTKFESAEYTVVNGPKMNGGIMYLRVDVAGAKDYAGNDMTAKNTVFDVKKPYGKLVVTLADKTTKTYYEKGDELLLKINTNVPLLSTPQLSLAGATVLAAENMVKTADKDKDPNWTETWTLTHTLPKDTLDSAVVTVTMTNARYDATNQIQTVETNTFGIDNPPELSSSIPAADQPNVNLTRTKLSMVFGEHVVPGAGVVTISSLANGVVPDNYHGLAPLGVADFVFNGKVEVESKTVLPLKDGLKYRVSVPAGFVKDEDWMNAVGNRPITWDFTVADLAPTLLSATVPESGSPTLLNALAPTNPPTKVAPVGSIVLTFSEEVDVTTPPFSLVVVGSNPTVTFPLGAPVVQKGPVYTVTLAYGSPNPLLVSTQMRLLPGGVKDLSGKLWDSSQFSLTFTTVDDIVAPTATLALGAGNSEMIQVTDSRTVTIQFSEAVRAFSAADLALLGTQLTSPWNFVDGASAYAFTLQATNNTPHAEYAVELPNNTLTDMAGNPNFQNPPSRLALGYNYAWVGGDMIIKSSPGAVVGYRKQASLDPYCFSWENGKDTWTSFPAENSGQKFVVTTDGGQSFSVVDWGPAVVLWNGAAFYRNGVPTFTGVKVLDSTPSRYIVQWWYYDVINGTWTSETNSLDVTALQTTPHALARTDVNPIVLHNIHVNQSDGKHRILSFTGGNYQSDDSGATWRVCTLPNGSVFMGCLSPGDWHEARIQHPEMSASGKYQWFVKNNDPSYTVLYRRVYPEVYWTRIQMTLGNGPLGYGYGIGGTIDFCINRWRGNDVEDGKYLYFMAGDPTFRHIYRSTDYGATWDYVLYHRSPYGIAVSKHGKHVFFNTDNNDEIYWRSSDYGYNWTKERYDPWGPNSGLASRDVALTTHQGKVREVLMGGHICSRNM
jgi:hypothetical protein